MARSLPPMPGWRYDPHSHGWYDASEYSSYREAKTSSQNLGFRNSGINFGWLSERQARRVRAERLRAAAGTGASEEPLDILNPQMTEPEALGRWYVQRSTSLFMLVDYMSHYPKTVGYYIIAYGTLLPTYETMRQQDSEGEDWRSVTTSLFARGVPTARAMEMAQDTARRYFSSVTEWGIVWREI